jgi:hypothetical protein
MSSSDATVSFWTNVVSLQRYGPLVQLVVAGHDMPDASDWMDMRACKSFSRLNILLSIFPICHGVGLAEGLSALGFGQALGCIVRMVLARAYPLLCPI